MRPTATAIATATATATASALATTTAFAVLSVLCGCTPSAAAATRPAAITRSAHLRFENCNAQHVILSVTVPHHAFTPEQAVTFAVRLRNTGGTTCGAPLAQHVPHARQTLTVGPCGTLPVVVRNPRGLDVYPGPVAYSCPAEFGFRLGPYSTAETTGSWNQTDVLGSPATTQQAPPGTYRLVVGGAVTVPVALAPG